MLQLSLPRNGLEFCLDAVNSRQCQVLKNRIPNYYNREQLFSTREIWILSSGSLIELCLQIQRPTELNRAQPSHLLTGVDKLAPLRHTKTIRENVPNKEHSRRGTLLGRALTFHQWTRTLRRLTVRSPANPMECLSLSQSIQISSKVCENV